MRISPVTVRPGVSVLRHCLAAITLLLLVACERAPTAPELQPGPPVVEKPSFSSSESVVVVESSVSHYQAPNGDEYVSFRDVDGNSYRMEALYDGLGRLREFRTWFNGQYLGSSQPTWSGMTRLGHYTSDGVYWASTTADAQRLQEGLVNGVGGGDGGCLNCDNMMGDGLGGIELDDAGVAWWYYDPCKDQFIRYGVATADLVFHQIAFGGAVLSAPATGPVAPWLVTSTIGFLGRSIWQWGAAVRALDQCVRANRFNDQ